MNLPDELRHPSGGEAIDHSARDAIRLAHRALDRFPDVVRQHKFIAGGAAVSSALVMLAGVALARRILGGQSEDEAVDSITEAELAGLRVVETTAEVEVTEEAASTNGGPPETEEPEEAGEPGEAEQFAGRSEAVGSS